MARGLVFCFIFTLAAGCEEPVWEPPGEVVFEGNFLELRVTGDAPTHCEGVPEYLDRYTGALYEELQVAPQDDLVIYAIAHPDDVRAFEEEDGQHFLAFSSPQGILSGTPVFEHELVHAVHQQAYGRQYLLTEGLAEMFGGDASIPDRVLTDGTAEELVEHVEEEGGIAAFAYGDAGRFVSFLDRRFGRETLLQLLEKTDRGDVMVEQFTSKVEDVTGGSWNNIASEYDGSEVCDQHQYWNASPACVAAEPLDLCEGSDDAWHVVDLDCTASGVLGERVDFAGDERPEIWTYRTITFEEPGRFGLFISGQWEAESVGYVELKQCSGGCGSFLQRFRVPVGPSVAESFDIEEPGDYLLKVARPLDAQSEVEFQIIGTCG